MADRYELAFIKNTLSQNSAADPQEESALRSLLFQRLLTGNVQIDSSGTITFNFSGKFGDGAVGSPSITFTNEATTGRYRIGANNVGEAVAGALKFDWNASRFKLASGYNLTVGANTLTTSDLLDATKISGNLPVANLASGTGAGATTFFRGDNSWNTAVTSVAVSAPAIFTISGSPVTTSGTLTLTASGTSGGVPYFNASNTMASSGALTANDLVKGGGAGAAPAPWGTQSANTILAGPTSGAAAVVTQRTLDPLDLHAGVVTAVGTQFDKTDTSLANITGLSYTVVAGKTYNFCGCLFVSAAAGGLKVAMGGTCTATTLRAQGVQLVDGATPNLPSAATSLGTAIIANGTTGAIVVLVMGYLVVNAGGTFTVQFAQNAASGTSSVLVGSYFNLF